MQDDLRRRLEILKARARALGKLRRGHCDAKDLEGEKPVARAPVGTGFLDANFEYNRIHERFISLEEAVPGMESNTPLGACYVIRTKASVFEPMFSGQVSVFADGLEDGKTLTEVFGPDSEDSPGCLPPGKFCFLDIETAGLSPNTYVFLCGTMILEDGELIMEQVLARDYSEEKAMLHRLQPVLESSGHVITYNGKSFDIPFIRTRMSVHRMQPRWNFRTLDLLRPARRVFSKHLPNCRLETVERYLIGRSRKGDVPGIAVPRVYHDFVNTGNALLMERVIYHNRMDLLAMVSIINTLRMEGGGDKI